MADRLCRDIQSQRDAALLVLQELMFTCEEFLLFQCANRQEATGNEVGFFTVLHNGVAQIRSTHSTACAQLVTRLGRGRL